MSMQPVNAEKPPPGGLTVGGVTIPPRVAGGGVIAIVVLIFILQNRDTSRSTSSGSNIKPPLWLWFTDHVRRWGRRRVDRLAQPHPAQGAGEAGRRRG